MRVTLALGVMLIVSAATPLAAQDSGWPGAQPRRPNTVDAASAKAPPVRVAPHRQPRAADVPATPATPLSDDEGDRILNQKINNICRGC